MKLLRTFPKVAFEFGLASGQWLGLREQTPRFATCFGDIFLESLDGWWFLDTVEGTIELRWTSAVTMYAELESPEGRATYLMDDLVRDARSRGLQLNEEDVYTFTPHPALGGELSVHGLSTMRFELALNWVGQMHDRVLHSSGEIRLPPMPDDGRRAAAQPVATAWDSAWSEDETFDVPFEQYLATTTFAAVATPRRYDDGHPSLPSSSGREPELIDQTPFSAPSYGAHSYAPPGDTAQPESGPAWPAQQQSAPMWSGQTEAAQQWQEPDHREPAAEGYEAQYDASYPAAEPYGAADQQPAGPYGQQDWVAYGADPDEAGQDQHGQAGPAWDSPTWGAPAWGGQAPAVAAGGSPQQPPRADDPFTAWDDLWGKR
ncbi:T6SS immunity protein Tdi1 domain-containing protein [Promicromonospora sp. Populi]|uniref:T6SS immunity protein Tdi1 domain-containing protein n=1 Tax=Promicromonospora sp. Populi TaxID=3239420 RepID=UPI0034E2978A